jgi:hypothetical protein
MDLRRSLMADAFGLSRGSSVEILGGKSSEVEKISLVGEVAGEDINVRWPEDM